MALEDRIKHYRERSQVNQQDSRSQQASRQEWYERLSGQQQNLSRVQQPVASSQRSQGTLNARMRHYVAQGGPDNSRGMRAIHRGERQAMDRITRNPSPAVQYLRLERMKRMYAAAHRGSLPANSRFQVNINSRMQNYVSRGGGPTVPRGGPAIHQTSQSMNQMVNNPSPSLQYMRLQRIRKMHEAAHRSPARGKDRER